MELQRIPSTGLRVFDRIPGYQWAGYQPFDFAQDLRQIRISGKPLADSADSRQHFDRACGELSRTAQWSRIAESAARIQRYMRAWNLL
jgi:hypothetical protein